MTNFRNLIITAALLIAGTVAAFAALPKTISYQGYLKDNTNAPVTATKTMGFALYSTANNGVPLWSESQSVTVDKGIYKAELGTATPLALPFDTRYYLGITVSPDGEMTPRIPLTSVSYALRAGCNPGDRITCYTGPAATFGVGVCKPGLRTCLDDGSSFGPCSGEVTPSQEVCYNNFDEDCDGKLDTGCPPRLCEPGSQTACYTGPNGTAGVGACKSGFKTCAVDGNSYGPCTEEVLPAPEVCDGMDNNCNGIVDDVISYPAVANGTYLCQNGASILVCTFGFAGCFSSGTCDIDLYTNLQNCGTCGHVCSFANASASCTSGICNMGSCKTGFGNCDNNTATGCEIDFNSDATHCGNCFTVCGQGQKCVSGVCSN